MSKWSELQHWGRKNWFPSGLKKDDEVSFIAYDEPTKEIYGGFLAHELEWKNIIAYRYKIEESDMNPDLEWLARNVDKWRGDNHWLIASTGDYPVWFDDTIEKCAHEGFTRAQWQAARQQLGLDQPEATEEGDEAWREKEPLFHGTPAELTAQLGAPKQARYQDAKGEDWIDEFARTATVEEFRGAMKFTIGRYNRRAGKKDELVKEIEKMRDYCGRWLEYEKRFL